VPTSTQVTIKIGSNATVGQQGAHWITNPSAGGVYTISVGGTFGGSGNMLVSINAGVQVSATVAESLSFTVSPSVSSVKMVQIQGEGGNSDITVNGTGSGNLLVVGVTNVGGTVTGITDNASGGPNTYASANVLASDSNSGTTTIWYAKNSRSGATDVMLAGTNLTSVVISFWEFSGIDQSSPLDTIGKLSNQSASLTPVGPSITTTLPGELIISSAIVQNSITGIHAGNVFTNDSISGDGFAHLIATSTGTFNAQWDQNSSGTYASNAVSFKPAPGCIGDDGATVNAIATTATSVPFGIISPNTFYQGCQDLIVSTNAGNGYSVTVQESSAMRTVDGRFSIPDTTCDGGTCTESAAAAWTNATKNGLGHTCFNQLNHDCNAVYSSGTNFRQAANLAAGETAQSVMSSSTAATATGRVKYRLSTSAAQPAGAYTTIISYTIYATY
jgi:hypothetical protein